MNSSPIYRLVLHPRDIRYAAPSWQPIIKALQTAGFISGAWGDENRLRFYAGDRFTNFITFMGCSPYIVFEPPLDGSLNFCHVQFSEIYVGGQFRSTSRNVFARCPQCRKRINHWETFVSQWRENPVSTVVRCDKCDAEVSLYDLAWRHTAGFARMFMDVYSIHPQEGVPTDQLLSLLEQASGSKWNYFYSDR
jgi:hypothetical protein